MHSWELSKHAHALNMALDRNDCDIMCTWYFLDDNVVRKISVLGMSQGPIEAGDFDGDGKSEWLFSGSSNDGTVYLTLHWDDFKQPNTGKF